MSAGAATAQLVALLERAAEERTREHWTAYLKGAAAFRGVPMATIRRAVGDVVREHDLAGQDVDQILDLALGWFAHEWSEDKLAAVLLIAERAADGLRPEHADRLAVPFEQGHVADWNVCDWYATKALHAYLAPGGSALQDRAERLVRWTSEQGLWQRRAGLVAFVKVAPHAGEQFDGFVDLVLSACEANLVSEERFAHTGPGWVLRELSRAAPDRVAQFVADHPELSREAQRMATAHLRPGRYRRR